MALAQNGDPLISDGHNGGIYRLHAGNLALVNGNDFISPQTPALMLDGKHLLVPDYLRGIAILDLNSGSVRWLAQQPTSETALNGTDGLYLRGTSLFLVQNGTSPERIMQLRLDPSLTNVRSATIIEQQTPTLGDPTHGVFAGDDFFYIANSGWSELDEHGDVKQGSKLTSARIMRFKPR